MGNLFGKSKAAGVTGYALITNPKLFKGLAYTDVDRDRLLIRGLLPAAIRPVDVQMESVIQSLHSQDDELSRYLILRELQDMNEHLFYRLLCEHTEEIMPYVYTPVVGQACMEYSRIYSRPRGMYISLKDAGKIDEVLKNWPEENVKAIVVTDGERILGLGDLGANGMPIPIGKLSLYTALAGIQPSSLMPVVLDVGTNNDALLKDKHYIGLKQRRVIGAKYDDFVDEFMNAVVDRFGRTCLIQFEDIGTRNAFRLLKKYNQNYCVFNDDIQGTASVVVAGILAGTRITNTKVSEHVFLFYGAGEAALGIADLLVTEMQEEGVSKDAAISHIWLVDSYGLVVEGRPEETLTSHKKKYIKQHRNLKELLKMVFDIKPSVLIGVSAQPGVFTKEVLETMMEENSKQPIIFALSNPTEKSECTAQEAYGFTKGKCIFASGSPFPPVTLNGKTFHPGQGNNVYIFPGMALALTACEATKVGNTEFLVAAKALAEMVTQKHMDEGRVYPPLDDIRAVSMKIATKVAKSLFESGQADHWPAPSDLEKFLASTQYNHKYE